MSTWEVVWEVGRAVYSLGLLALGAVVIAGTPSTVRVLRDLTSALTAAAAGLRAQAADRAAIEEVRQVVLRVEAAQAEDRKLLERLLRKREGDAP